MYIILTSVRIIVYPAFATRAAGHTSIAVFVMVISMRDCDDLCLNKAVHPFVVVVGHLILVA